MNSIKRISLIAALLAAFLSLPALAQKVETDYDHAVNFSQYHTYSWGRALPPIPFLSSAFARPSIVTCKLKGGSW